MFRPLNLPAKRRLNSRRPLVVAGLLFLIAAPGTDGVQPSAIAGPPPKSAASRSAPDKAQSKPANQSDPSYAIRGQCVGEDGRTVAGIRLRLLKLDGSSSPPVEVAQTVSDARGRFAFARLVPPRDLQGTNRLAYGIEASDEQGLVGIAAM